MPPDPLLLERFHRALVHEIRKSRPDYLKRSFPIEEIYEELVPYRTHRNVIGVAMNGDYEDALLRLLGGEGDYLVLQSDAALREIHKELASPNPNPSRFRDFGNADVRLNPARVGLGPDEPGTDNGGAAPAKKPVPGTTLPPRVAAESPPEGKPGASGTGKKAPATAATMKAPGPRGGGSAPRPVGGERAPESVRGSQDAGPVAREKSAANSSQTATSGNIVPVQTLRPVPPRPPAPPPAERRSRRTVQRTCRWCDAGLPNRDPLNYCPFCGRSLRLIPCRSCGEALEASWRFCAACGAEVAAR